MTVANYQDFSPNDRLKPARALATGLDCNLLCTAGLVLVVLSQLFACGGSAKGKHYDKAINKQEGCCQRLKDDKARSQCMETIVRVDDPAAKDTEVNDATFRCVERNFVCDASTGRATRESSQTVFDCISDLDD